ncbi:Hypothetical predicted protein [Olea europaea subsp. europaea]|uniref:Secreted protein n=1 Tax=Olea europaea subsp. europaea TaxID=158383 RepID=A0A8S0R3A2_OLEEU|nr:Hypothetical predicted protein [Olea europaea subsp. europaea]
MWLVCLVVASGGGGGVLVDSSDGRCVVLAVVLVRRRVRVDWDWVLDVHDQLFGSLCDCDRKL